MELLGVRFNQAIHIGRGLDLQSYLEPGQSVLSDTVSLAAHDTNFLRVSFKSGYSQLIPWAQVATVFYKESDAVSSKHRS